MWSREATVGDLRRIHEEATVKSYVSSLDWIASGAFVDRGQPDDTPLFPRSTAIGPTEKDSSD